MLLSRARGIPSWARPDRRLSTTRSLFATYTRLTSEVSFSDTKQPVACVFLRYGSRGDVSGVGTLGREIATHIALAFEALLDRIMAASQGIRM